MARDKEIESFVQVRDQGCLAFQRRGRQPCGWYFQPDGQAESVRVNGHLDCKHGELVTVLDDVDLPADNIRAVYPLQRHLPAQVRCHCASEKN